MTAIETSDKGHDPKGLIREAYRIDGIGPGECRSIFLDWALSLPEDTETERHIEALLRRHDDAPDHPMSQVLREGLASGSSAQRRGGARGRRGRL